MEIVDAQVHIWGANTPERPWPARHPPHRPEPYTEQALLADMDAADVDRAIIVPPSWEGDRNDLALAAAARHPDRLAIMGRLDAESPQAREAVATWRQQPGMLGLRFTFHTPVLETPLIEGRIDWLWAAAEKAGVPIAVLVPQVKVPLIDRIAERHPGLRLLMDHLAIPPGQQDDDAFRNLDKLLAIAKRPNVAVKATAVPCCSSEPYPYRNLHGSLRRVFDAFGPKRMFWGTDVTRLPCTYRRGITMFTEELGWLGAEDREWVMGRGVRAWLGW